MHSDSRDAWSLFAEPETLQEAMTGEIARRVRVPYTKAAMSAATSDEAGGRTS